MPTPVKVEPKENLIIHLEYNNGLRGEVDLTKTIKRNNYETLEDRSEFTDVYIDERSGEICWPCGISICKDALYKQLELKELMKRLKIDIDKTDS